MSYVPDMYYVGVKARFAGIPKLKNPYNILQGFIDITQCNKMCEEWNRGWETEDAHLRMFAIENYTVNNC